MNQCVYAKYNRHRLPRFQIETSIQNRGDKRVVVKKALAPAAANHIADMALAHKMVAANIADNSMVVLPDSLQNDDESFIVEFINGASIDSFLLQAFLKHDTDRFRKIVDDYARVLNKGFQTSSRPAITEQLKLVFGLKAEKELDGLAPYFALTMIDPLFENILIYDGRCFLIDNEWVFKGSLPVSFVLFRSLFYFFKVKYVDFGIENFISFEAELKRHGINKDMIELYLRMDDAFQAYVFGKEPRSIYKHKYARQRYSVPLLEQTIKQQRELIKDIHAQTIARDGVIADMMSSRGWRFVQSITNLFNRSCPPGTRRRNMIARLLKLTEAGKAK